MLSYFVVDQLYSWKPMLVLSVIPIEVAHIYFAKASEIGMLCMILLPKFPKLGVIVTRRPDGVVDASCDGTDLFGGNCTL